MQFAASSAKMNPIDKYFIAKNMDWPGSTEYIEGLKKMLPPGLLQPKPGDQPPQPMPPSPQMQLAMEKEKTEQLKQLALMAKLGHETVKAQKDSNMTEDKIKDIVLGILRQVHQ